MAEFTFKMQVDSEFIAREVPSQRVMELVVTPPAAAAAKPRPALNLGLAIDCSGSMAGNKLEYVQHAAVHLLEMLQEQDRVALVAYGTEVTLVSPSVVPTAAARAELIQKIRALKSGSMTNLSGGWLAGCEQVARSAADGHLNRVLLLSDGLANVGIRDLEELGMHAGQLLQRGVPTSTFGVGQDFDERLMEHMANQGGGRFYYIQHPRQIPEIFQQEFQELAAVTARNVQVALELPDGVAVEVLGNWRTEHDGGRWHLWLGDLAVNQQREVYVTLLTPPAGSEPQITVRGTATATGESGRSLQAEAQVWLRFAPEAEVKAAPVQQELMERYSLVAVATRAAEALKLEREGQRDEAKRHMRMHLTAHAAFMPAAARAEYDQLAEGLSHGLNEDERKDRWWRSYTQKQRRGR